MKVASPAREAPHAVQRKRQIAPAQEALAVSADRTDVYCLLAEEAAPTLEDAAELYRQGVDAGERAQGRPLFEEDVGDQRRSMGRQVGRVGYGRDGARVGVLSVSCEASALQSLTGTGHTHTGARR